MTERPDDGSRQPRGRRHANRWMVASKAIATTTALVLTLAAGLCEGNSSDNDVCNVFVDGVTPSIALLPFGSGTDLKATYTRSCTHPTTELATWATSDPSIATIDSPIGPSVHVTGVGSGTAHVTANGRFSAEITVQLAPVTAVNLVVTPSTIPDRLTHRLAAG